MRLPSGRAVGHTNLVVEGPTAFFDRTEIDGPKIRFVNQPKNGPTNFGQKSAEEVIDALQKRLGINLPKERTIKNM